MFKKSLLIMLLMAMFAPWAANAQTRAIVYQKVTEASQLTTTDTYILVNEANSKVATTTSSSSNGITAADVTISSNTISTLPNGVALITLTKSSTKYIIKNDTKDLDRNSSGNLWWSTSGNNRNWTISFSGNEIAINCPYNSSDKYIYYDTYDSKFEAHGTSGYGQVALYIRTEVSAYPNPTNLNVTALGTDNATIEWTAPTAPNGCTLNGYECQYKAGSGSWTSASATGTSCSITGLTANTQYTFQVKAIYTDSESATQYSDWAETTFTTDCAEISVPTQTWNFDASTNMPDCWKIVVSSTVPVSGNPVYPMIYNNNTYSHSGNNTLAFRGTGEQVVLMPAINNPLNGKTLSFYVRAYSTSYTNTLSIGYYNSSNEFVAYGTNLNINYISYSSNPIEIDFAGLPSYVNAIAIKGFSNNIYGSIYIDDIKIIETSNCKPVKNLQLGTIAANSAKLKWTAGTTETNWKLQYKTSAAENYSTVNVSSTDLDGDGYYTLGSLAENTTYNWQVAAWCNTEDPTAITEYVAGTNFTTIQTPVTVDADHPYSDNFESVNNWFFINGEAVNAWAWGTATHNGEGSTKAMYISNDGGTTNAYTMSGSKYALVYATKTFTFAEGSYTFQYDWKANGESTYDYLRVALIPSNVELTPLSTSASVPSGFGTTTLPTGWTALDGGSKLNLSNSFQTKEVANIEITAGTYKVAFVWRNDGSGGSNDPAAIDNFSITPVSCETPTALAASNIRSNSATLNWTSDAINFVLQYSTSSEFPSGVSTKGIDVMGATSVTLSSASQTALEANQTYYVRVKTNCGNDDYSAYTDYITFTTEPVKAPENLSVDAITTTQARLVWTGASTNDGHTSYEVCFSTTNSVPSTLTPDENYFTGIIGTQKLLTGLTSGTTYYAWVRDVCGTTSEWAAFDSFNTDCENITTFPFIQDFESLSEDYTIPACWDNTEGTTGSNSTYKWYYTTINSQNTNYGRTNGTGHNNSNCVRFESLYNDEGKTNFLKTPTIELPNTNVILEFWYKNPNGGDLSVYITYDDTDYEIATGLTGALDWTKKEIDITTPSNKEVVIKFKGTSNWGNTDAHIYLDDISINVYDKVFNKITDNGLWTESANWNPAGEPVANQSTFINGAATIPSGCIATSSNITLGETGSLTIADGGQLITNNAVTATVQKSIEAYSSATGVGNTDGWYFIASPVDNFSTSAIIGSGTDLFLYDEEHCYWYSTQGLASPFTTLTRGQGYLFASNTGNDLAFTGEMPATNDEVTVDLSFAYAGATSLRGFNLVGNPFTRNITSDNMKLATTTDKTTTYSAVTAYYVVENGAEITSSTDPIKPGRGFMVQAGEANQKLVFNHTSKAETYAKPSFIIVEAGNAEFMDRALVQIGGGNTLRKMTINDQVSHVYVINDGKDYAAATVDELKGEMPVCFDAAQDGQYTISVSTDNVEMGYMHLVDMKNGMDIDLMATPSYTFEAKANDNAGRFRLLFRATGVEENTVDNEEGFAFVSNGQIVVTGEGTLRIVDMLGRTVGSYNTNERISTEGLTPGVYVLQLIGGEKTMTQKIVVR